MAREIGTHEDDFLYDVNNQNNYFRGNGGDDRIAAGGGNDIIDGGFGSDMLFGGNGNDEFWLTGPNGLDSFHGGAGYDRVILNNYSHYAAEHGLYLEYITGDTERVENNTGYSDVFIKVGGLKKWIETSGYGNFKDIVLEGFARDGYQTIIGGDMDDVIIGTSNPLSSSLSDRISGNGGNDNLSGGLEDDILTGGAGTDVFEFRAAEGHDTVTDFAAGEDKLHFIGTSATDITGLNISVVGGDTIVTIDNTTITIESFAGLAEDMLAF